GKPQHIPGHSLPFAALGVFILWFGWFGFNAGSTTTGDTSIALIAMNTFLAAAAGATFSMIVTWLKDGKPDAPMTINGVLAGLVGITAGCANLSPGSAIIAGAIAGIIMVYSSEWLETFVDDPVGAIAVHGVCGAWGTLAAGLFDTTAGLWGTQGFDPSIIGVQLLGIAAAFVWTFVVSYVLFSIIKSTVGLRVNGELEAKGLDLHEHDNRAYPEFVGSDEFIEGEV
ncbi:MAG: ammonium transporter, partial [Balneolaceae bacterium]|nr:ammonium transporter [Balneolaceae bacterium]